MQFKSQWRGFTLGLGMAICSAAIADAGPYTCKAKLGLLNEAVVELDLNSRDIKITTKDGLNLQGNATLVDYAPRGYTSYVTNVGYSLRLDRNQPMGHGALCLSSSECYICKTN